VSRAASRLAAGRGARAYQNLNRALIACGSSGRCPHKLPVEWVVSPFVLWLDQALGPPWSGLVVLAMIGSLSAFSAYVAIRTIHYVYRDKP